MSGIVVPHQGLRGSNSCCDVGSPFSGCCATGPGGVGGAASVAADLHDGIVRAASERRATLLEVEIVPMAEAPKIKRIAVATVVEAP